MSCKGTNSKYLCHLSWIVMISCLKMLLRHDDVIKWKHFPRYWPFVRGIHRSPVNSPHKGQWRGDLMFSLICVWTNGWVNNRQAGDLRRSCAHYDVIVMVKGQTCHINSDAGISVTIFMVSNMYLASPIYGAGVINHIKTRTNVRAPG